MADKTKKPTIGILIPTYQGVKHLKSCLLPLLQSSLNPRILVIDSSSKDGTAQLVRSLGVELVIIPKKEFNHGATREWGRKMLATDIVVMITQDAYPTCSNMLNKLLAPLLHHQASVSYARQIPHKNAGLLAAFARKFNYPSTSHIRNINDSKHFGVYTFFCSNSCAAYLNQALDEVGGFPSLPFGEDTAVVAKLLHQNHSIAYVSEAVVYHSHDYSLMQEFYRHIEIGSFREKIKHLIALGGNDRKRGSAYTKALFKELLRKRKRLLATSGEDDCCRLWRTTTPAVRDDDTR